MINSVAMTAKSPRFSLILGHGYDCKEPTVFSELFWGNDCKELSVFSCKLLGLEDGVSKAKIRLQVSFMQPKSPTVVLSYSLMELS